MILTCPECATSYFVDDSRIPDGGRMVKCSNCGARWEVRHEPTVILEPPGGAAAEPEPAPAAEEPAAAEAATPPEIPPDDLEFAPAEPVAPEAAAEPEPEPRRAASRRTPPPAGRDATGKVLVWASAAALVVALVGGAIAFRGDVVRLWPKSQLAYEGLGLPVNAVGLVIEGVRAEPTFLGGRPVLSVTGSIRNVRGQAVTAPPLRINLLNRAGKPIAAKVVRPVDARVPAGATRHFAIAISDPPSNARDLEVMFENSPQHAATAAVPGTAAAPPPAEAQPPPAGTPESLSEHG